MPASVGISKRNLVIVVVIIVLGSVMGYIAVTGVPSRQKGIPITVPEGSKAGDLTTMKPYTYKAGDIEYAAERGTFVVAENRGAPDSRFIALPVVRIRATGSDPTEPIFWLTGGPGHTNLEFSHIEGLIEKHDIVLVGYRGVDGSVVLQLPEVVKALKGVGGELFSDASMANIGEAYTRGVNRLQGEGIDLDGYTIVEIIEDMEAVRIALGYERINLISQSFGTRVAMIYMWMHPDSLLRVALVCVNPPEHMVWEPDDIDRLIEYDAKLFAQEAKYSVRTKNLVETMRNVAHNMPRRWLFFPIDPGKVKSVSHFTLQHRGSAAQVFDAFIVAENGDPSGLALMSIMYDFMVPSVNVWGFSIAMAITADHDPSRDYINKMDPPDSILGAPLSVLFWGPTNYMDWPTPPIPSELRKVQSSDVETLMVSGSADYSNPPWIATNELMPYLINGEQVILSEFGHTKDFWDMQPEASKHLLTTFYETGEVDDSRYTYQPMDFHVGLGYPEIAKIGLGIMVLVVIGLATLVWFMVRKVRHV